jgi:hypothetical protein
VPWSCRVHTHTLACDGRGILATENGMCGAVCATSSHDPPSSPLVLCSHDLLFITAQRKAGPFATDLDDGLQVPKEHMIGGQKPVGHIVPHHIPQRRHSSLLRCAAHTCLFAQHLYLCAFIAAIHTLGCKSQNRHVLQHYSSSALHPSRLYAVVTSFMWLECAQITVTTLSITSQSDPTFVLTRMHTLTPPTQSPEPAQAR